MPFKTIEDQRAYARSYHARNPHKYDAVRKAWAAKNRPPKGRVRKVKTVEEKREAKRLEYQKYKEKYRAHRQQPEVRERYNAVRRERMRALRAEKPQRQIQLLSVEEKRQRQQDYKKQWWTELRSNPIRLAEHNAKKAEGERRRLEEAKSNPEALEALRAKRWEATERWRSRDMEENPEKYARYKEMDRLRKAEVRNQPDYYPKANAWARQHRAKNPTVRLAQAVRNTMNSALRGRYKAGTFIERIGCTAGELKEHLEKQFTEGMSWENFGHGRGFWTMDHILPCASFDLSNPEQQKKCFHYTNLRPMWFVENCSKNSIIDGQKHYHGDHTSSLQS